MHSTTQPNYNNRHQSPLEYEIVAKCSVSKARVAKLKLPHFSCDTCMFMPVGTQGTIKGITTNQLRELDVHLILGNTYHLGQREGLTQILEDLCSDRLHEFIGWNRAMLTDSGGFQMVSLLELAEITEQGVTFQSPHDGSEMLLTPEESMKIQNQIGADIMMALDDVVATTCPDRKRVEEAMHRTIRWIDRCINAHKRTSKQNLFGIIQGGLDKDLRSQCLKALIERDLPGYAIGGLSGGESKHEFWRVVDQCTDALPPNKPRYCMGVGYAEDIVVCVALGVDMFDCVYPCRTARFGTALSFEGNLNLKLAKFANDFSPLDSNVNCFVDEQFTRAFFHNIINKDSNAAHLLTLHNIAFMMKLMKGMREAIIKDEFPQYVQQFFLKRYPKRDYPEWAVEALAKVNITLLQH